MYASNTIYVVGDAKAPQNNPITEKFKSYFVAFVLVKETGEIVDANCSATIALTSQFVKYLFLHKNINDPALVTEIKDRYFGSSQKALLVALKDAKKKYNQIAALSTQSKTKSSRKEVLAAGFFYWTTKG
ncbi:DUF3870 domain-containing protein [Bacillus toyonensis]|uniref:DUF3870 domain-containing protein n=1 Tax=Bacillus toyonensis TaxID=155322 RepID=A0A2A8HEX3_9BACI|nr:DUF3870 domain-containing protein [Bacillus toyonensis]PEQ05466.1 hypothetical protein CN585_15855 [Bacillus toyonensis]